jgi:hypothetical protein
VVSAQTIFPAAEAHRTEAERDCGCRCGCAPCDDGCRLECLERPRFFCGQLLTDADLAAMVEYTRARLGLVRYRDGWGVVCGLDVRCDAAKASVVTIGEGYAVSCCGSDIVLCEPAVVDLSDACRPPASPCDDPCAPKPKPQEPEENENGERSPWDCPDGVWVDVLVDALDEEAAGRSVLATDGCRRVGTCEASRVRETHRIFTRRSAGDPLERAEHAWTERFERCFAEVEEAGLPWDDTTYGELRVAVARFAHDHACGGGCRVRRWLCPPGAPADDTVVVRTDVQRIRLALLLDCLVCLGRCDCHACAPGSAVMLARVLVVPGAGEACPCRVVAVDDAPPYRRPIGHDCPPARTGWVNLGDLVGKRPEGVYLEVRRRGLDVIDLNLVDADEALGRISRKRPPIFGCDEDVDILAVDDECVGWRVVGFASNRTDRRADRVVAEEEMMRVEGMTPRRVDRLDERGIRSVDELAVATAADIRHAFPGTTDAKVDAIREQAASLRHERRT